MENPRFSSAKESTAGPEREQGILLGRHEEITRGCSQKTTGVVGIHHDGAPAHTANLVQQFLTKHGTIPVARPPYSPDMSPPDFFLFPKIKNTLKGHRFQDIETIKQNSTQQLHAISKSEFQKCFEDWKHR
ncbi:putative mariner transposase [Trichonephila clavipes]|nr:putative mariner transposase [Trichonephila clavipes]